MVEYAITRLMSHWRSAIVAAKSAVSAALHDLAGKRLGIPVSRLLGLDGMKMPRSSFTIGIPETMADLRQRVEEAAEYPIIKVKLGSDRDVEIIRTVRLAAPDKVLRVDANAAWTPKHALAMIPLLRELGVEFVEQPLAAGDLEGMRLLRERSPLPIIADESIYTIQDAMAIARTGAADVLSISRRRGELMREAAKVPGAKIHSQADRSEAPARMRRRLIGSLPGPVDGVSEGRSKAWVFMSCSPTKRFPSPRARL